MIELRAHWQTQAGPSGPFLGIQPTVRHGHVSSHKRSNYISYKVQRNNRFLLPKPIHFTTVWLWSTVEKIIAKEIYVRTDELTSRTWPMYWWHWAWAAGGQQQDGKRSTEVRQWKRHWERVEERWPLPFLTEHLKTCHPWQFESQELSLIHWLPGLCFIAWTFDTE